jgi:hypothetical protein
MWLCADLALATGEATVAWVDGSQLVFLPDVYEALSEEVGPLPPTWRLARADGRFVRVYGWPGAAS